MSDKVEVDPFVFTFGKYKNLDVREVLKTDSGVNYCKWLLKQQLLDLPKSIKDEITNKVEENKPIVKELH